MQIRFPGKGDRLSPFSLPCILSGVTPNRLILLALAMLPAAAQTPLTLREAVRIALEKHPSIEAAAAQTRAAESRIDQARAGYLPRVDYTESVQRSNNPVFVFGTLLTQRRFSQSNFALDSLNRPDFLNNFQSQVSLDQTIYDFGATRAGVRSAELSRQITSENERMARMGRIAQVARLYHGAVLGAESLEVARKSVASAEADLARAEAVRAAGMSTDADVLSIQVHLAAAREREITRRHELDVARAALNDALGLPLSNAHTLTTPLAELASTSDPTALESAALSHRPEARQTGLATQQAEAQSQAARAALYPKIVARAAIEADRGRFATQAGANWFFSAGLRWNLFNGNADRARIDEASHAASATRASRREVESAVQLQVRQAAAALESARERIRVAEAAVSQAEESLRITRNRYEAGLATVTDLLRNETALMESRTRRLAAVYDSRVAAVMLELAAGTLSGDNDVLQ
ncbi:MAG: TolC family protein [Acidimicrobiia bacterium]|nr:TolC family protein [Acidimicrobiia bacterium]